MLNFVSYGIFIQYFGVICKNYGVQPIGSKVDMNPYASEWILMVPLVGKQQIGLEAGWLRTAQQTCTSVEN